MRRALQADPSRVQARSSAATAASIGMADQCPFSSRANSSERSLSRRVVNFEIDRLLKRRLQIGFNRAVELLGQPAIGRCFAPEEVVGQQRLAVFLLLGLVNQAVNHAGVVVDVLVIQALREVELVLLPGVEVTEQRPHAVTQRAADQPQKSQRRIERGKADEHDLDRGHGNARERGQHDPRAVEE